MVYELYVDKLFLINFVMNLYLLILVDRSCMRTATRVRLLMGAGVGAIAYVAAFLIDGPVWLKWPVMLLAGAGIMLWITFRPRSFRSILKLVRQLSVYSFLMGGLLLFFGNVTPVFHRLIMQVNGVLGCGAVIFLLLGYLQEQEERKKTAAACEVKLITEAGSVCVTAFVDTGNSLTEPISGKPVSVIDAELFAVLWPKAPAIYRVIPYHSVGKAHGIMRGYQVPEMEVETDGISRHFRDVYVAVCEEKNVSGLILNPRLFSRTGEQKQNRKFVKRKERADRDDSESGNAGKTAV